MKVIAKLPGDIKRSRKKIHTDSAPRTDMDAVEPSDFSQLLNSVVPVDSGSAVNLNQLWQELPGIEKNLLEHPSSSNLESYKKLVYEIAREILARNVKLITIKRKNHNGKKIEMNLLEFVDNKLKRMAEIIFDKGIPAFHLLKTTQEIRGMLLDCRK